jgi:hypothetical protein
MKNRIIIILTGIFIISLSSCLKDIFCVNGDGIVEIEKRRTTSFDKISNSTSFEIVYKKADTTGVSITAEQNIINHIETNVYDHCLKVNTSPGTRCLDYTIKPVITVASPALKQVEISGSGDFVADTISGDEIVLKITGSGDISAEHISGDVSLFTISGSGNIDISNFICPNTDILITGSGNATVRGEGEESHLRITGSGNIYSGGFQVKTASVIISGSGNAYADIEVYLNGLLSGSGNIYLKGNPEIDQTVTGSGRIIKHK